MRGTGALTLGRALKSTDNRLAFPRLNLLKALALLRCQGLIPHTSYSEEKRFQGFGPTASLVISKLRKGISIQSPHIRDSFHMPVFTCLHVSNKIPDITNKNKTP